MSSVVDRFRALVDRNLEAHDYDSAIALVDAAESLAQAAHAAELYMAQRASDYGDGMRASETRLQRALESAEIALRRQERLAGLGVEGGAE